MFTSTFNLIYLLKIVKYNRLNIGLSILLYNTSISIQQYLLEYITLALFIQQVAMQDKYFLNTTAHFPYCKVH